MKNNLKNLSAWMIYFDTGHEQAEAAAAALAAHVFPTNAPREPLAAVRQYLEANGYPPEIALSVRSVFDFIGERNRGEAAARGFRALVYLSHDDDAKLDGARFVRVTISIVTSRAQPHAASSARYCTMPLTLILPY